MLQPDSLAVRLMLFAVVLVVATAGLIGGLAYTRTRRVLDREARTRLAIIARNVAQSLDREIADRASDVTSWAHLSVMRAVVYHDVDKELAEFIRQIVTGGQAYIGISCVDARGGTVATEGDVAAIVPSGAWSGRTPSPVRVSLVTRSDALGRLLQFETPLVDPERGGQAIGALTVLVDPRRLLQAAETALGTAGTHLAFEIRLRNEQRAIVGVADDVPARPGGPSSGDAPPLTGTAPVRQALADGALLDVVVSEPAAEAFAAVTALRGALLRRVVFVLILGAALGGVVAWRIGKPIRRLTDAVRRITEQGSPLQLDWEFRSAAGEVGVLATAFRAMLERLVIVQAEAVMQSRLALLGEIAANVAHEVRTPLSTLKTSAQLLARRELPPAQQRELAAAVTEEVDRLNVVVTDLVDLARPKPMSYRRESLPDIVQRAEAFFAPVARKQRVVVDVEIEPDLPRFYGSADQIYQVVLNLVHNALQAVPSGGGIVVRCRRESEWIALEVQDDGPGFAPEILAKAFTRFCTTKPDGTGLGLAVSRRIVEEHGGTIVAENVPGGGARVRLQLRAREDG